VTIATSAEEINEHPIFSNIAEVLSQAKTSIKARNIPTTRIINAAIIDFRFILSFMMIPLLYLGLSLYL
jgi:hypothetical protein